YDATDGIIFLPEPSSSPYTATIKGTDTGTYHFDVLQMGTSDSLWKEYTNTVTRGSEEKYTVSVGTTVPVSEPISDQTLKQSVNELSLILTGLPTTPESKKIENKLREIAETDKKNRPKDLRNDLEQILHDIFILRKSLSDVPKRNATVVFIDKLISIYIRFIHDEQKIFNSSENIGLKNSNNTMQRVSSTNLQNAAEKGKLTSYRAIIYEKGVEYQLTGNAALSASNLSNARINLLTSLLFFRESISSKD
ncbi:hypothetical protein HY947_01690, partial [Candidatus Gottesmanbacteria bacterium]|nr:hypothetical protein [Candidatus Gottesmanbacteria bacterium]